MICIGCKTKEVTKGMREECFDSLYTTHEGFPCLKDSRGGPAFIDDTKEGLKSWFVFGEGE